MRPLFLLCAVMMSCHLLARGLAGSDAQPPAIAEVGGSLPAAEFIQWRAKLRSSDPAEVQAAQASLCVKLEAASTPAALVGIAAVLSAAPNEQAVRASLAQLERAETPAMRAAACDAFASVAAGHTFADQPLREAALSRLAALLDDPAQPPRVLNAALQALAALGPRGLDVLAGIVKSDPHQVRRRADVFCTALGLTGDPRALPLLVDALSDPQMEGRRTQAAHAIGQLAAAGKLQGHTIDEASKRAALKGLRRLMEETTSEQLLGLCLKAMGALQDYQGDEQLRELVLRSLQSSSYEIQDAALQVIYAADQPPAEPGLVADVRARLGSADANCRATAEAILGKFELDQHAAQP